jgi:transglutaminase-like putative cysteine protease
VCGGQHDPRADSANNTAKSRMFVPGAGWITFDPTNRSVGGRDLIPVAVARDISQCTPVSGSFFGPSNSFLSMGVTVSVTA